jgi:hypothetical protein
LLRTDFSEPDRPVFVTDSTAAGSAGILLAFNAGEKPALLAEVRCLGGSPNLLGK